LFDVVLRLLNASWLAGLGIPRKQFFLVFALLFNAFTWYYMTLFVIESLPQYLDAFRAIFYVATIGASLAGAILSEKVTQLKLLYLWMILGAVASLQLTFASIATVAHLSVMFILIGVSFGIGMPSCLAYLANNTSVENRGKTSAIVFLLVNLAAFPLALILSMFDTITNSLLLASWRALGLIAFAFLRPSTQETEPRRPISIKSVLQDRSFVLYLIPWLMFSIIDTVETALLTDFFGTQYNSLTFTIKPVIASLAMLVGGLLSDRIGRKRVVMYGFVSLGIAYAIIGTAPMLPLAWNVYLVVDAIAAGILWIIFIMILWGDLSTQQSREKYYVIGSIPFLATAAVPLSMMPLASFLQANTAFSLASFFLFLAVLPLMYAPETLPQKKIELRRLRGYVDQAKKLAGKREEEN
jgi:MFS family permease